MTRRTFVKTVIAAVSVAAAGLLRSAVKAGKTCQVFVRATGLGRYPGRLKPVPDFLELGEWSG